MKSLLISSTYFPPQVGGISRIMEYLAESLGRVQVCCLTGAGGTAPRIGARVYRSPAAFSDRSMIVRAVAWGHALSSIMLRDRPKAVLLGTVYDGSYGRWLRRWFGLPYVIYAHGNEILKLLGPSGCADTRDILRQADGVVAVSRFTAELVRQAGYPADKITVVHPGCDLRRFGPRAADQSMRRRILGERHEDRVILTTGNLVERKGHDVVIRALARLLPAMPHVTYLIVGDGPNRSELERLAVALGVRDHVVFAGHVADADLPDMYALSDVFVMVSRERWEDNDVEGFGLVYLEAAACEKPVIGGRSGGIPEAVVDGVTGLLVDPESHAEVAGALEAVLTDREFATRLGAQGRARVLREFTWSQAADRIDKVMTAAAMG